MNYSHDWWKLSHNVHKLFDPHSTLYEEYNLIMRLYNTYSIFPYCICNAMQCICKSELLVQAWPFMRVRAAILCSLRLKYLSENFFINLSGILPHESSGTSDIDTPEFWFSFHCLKGDINCHLILFLLVIAMWDVAENRKIQIYNSLL